MSVARFIADQRTNYRVPHTLSCAVLGVSVSWVHNGSTGRPLTGSAAAANSTTGSASSSRPPGVLTVHRVCTPT